MLHVAFALFVAVTRPALVEEIVLGGTAATAPAVALVATALHLLRRAPRFAAPQPASARVGAFPVRAGRLLAALGTAGALLLLLLALVVALAGWWLLHPLDLLGRPAVRAAPWRLASALAVLGLDALLRAAVATAIAARLSAEGLGTARARALLALFRKAFAVALAALAGTVALSRLGLGIAPLLAGVVGLAIGFGAQTIVRDVITGVFIQLEGVMDVGHVVGVAGTTGAVEKVAIRSVRLRAPDGAVHVIPFSAVGTVTNLSRGFAFREADAGLRDGPLAADLDGPLDLQGVAELRPTGLLVRSRLRTRAGRQRDVGRRYGERLAAALSRRGVLVPPPARSVSLPTPGAAPA